MGDPEETRAQALRHVVVFCLSVYVLAALAVETFFPLPDEVTRLLMYFDTVVCVVFIVDFFIEWAVAKNRWKYLRWGWIDLVASIPGPQVLRVGRVVRMLRILRILRGVRSMRAIFGLLYGHRARGAIVTSLLMAFVLMVFCSIAILNLETSPKSNIKTAEDAIWWAFSTMTMGGYGECYPVTTGGRLVAAVLMTAGVALFGVFTAYVAALFLEEQKGDKSPA